jgi:hypothetical protein
MTPELKEFAALDVDARADKASDHIMGCRQCKLVALAALLTGRSRLEVYQDLCPTGRAMHVIDRQRREQEGRPA